MTDDTCNPPCELPPAAPRFSPEEAVSAFLEPMCNTAAFVTYGSAARHFLYWLDLIQVAVAEVDMSTVQRFAGHACCCPRYSPSRLHDPYYINKVGRFVRFLEDRGDICVADDVVDLDQHLDRFADRLAASGYNPWSRRVYNSAARHFAIWLRLSRIRWHDVDQAVIERFAGHDCRCAAGRKRGSLSDTGIIKRRRAASRFFAFLKESGGIAVPEPARACEPVLDAYRIWLGQHCGMAEKTIERYTSEAARWLPELGSDPSGYDASVIRGVVLNQPTSRSRASMRTTASVLHSFLRFQIAFGRCRPELQHAVPFVAPRRLSTLPRYADEATIERIIAACGTTTPAELRDRAIILLLARLGLRAGDIWQMRIADIDWGQGLLRVHGKGRRTIGLPLPQDAGDAVLAYLEQARPFVAEERLFLCVCAPFKPFASSSEISGILSRLLARAGITGVPTGAHMFRHSLATKLLRNGAGLEAVGAVLRHQSPDTTSIYAKVDIPMLQKIVQTWPGDVAC